jgi:predicted RNA-binding protein with PUA-like domain
MAAAAYSIVKQRVRIVELLAVVSAVRSGGREDRDALDSAVTTAHATADADSARGFFRLLWRMKNFWLVKQEPSSYSWSDFVLEGQTSWTGVRNYAARNNLRKMQEGDEVLFYHSGEEKAVVGIAKVMRRVYRDPTATEGDWSTVDLAPLKPLRHPVTLREIKANSQLKGIPLIRQSRLSVMPLAESAFREIVKMSKRGATAS